MDTIQNVTQCPTLADLARWSDYWRANTNIFPTKAAADWFMRTRKGYLVERGLLVETCKGYLVRKAGLDAALIELLGGAK